MANVDTRFGREELLEREAEMAIIDTGLEAARAGTGSLILIEGSAGVGKSRLLHEGLTLGREKDMDVLRARPAEPERDFPFGVALQLFESRLAEADEPARRELLSGAAALASVLFSGERWGRTLPDDERTLFSLLHGLVWLASNLADQRPLVLAVDDAHWADSSSLRYLLYLTQRIEDLPIAVLATLRPGEPGADEAILAELLAHHYARMIELRPLSDRAVEALILRSGYPDADPEFCRACAEVTGGNPFLLHELLRTVQGDGLPADSEGAQAIRRIAPSSVARSVLLRLSRMGPDASAVARAGAILGDGVFLGSVAALAELEPEEADSAFDALAAAEILRAEDSVSFVHPLVRASVYGDIPPAERARWHTRAARLLHGVGAPPEVVAGHLLRGSPSGEGWEVQMLEAAARRATARGVPEVAARFLSCALKEVAESEARAGVLLSLGRVETTAGRPEAERHLSEALEATSDRTARAETLLALGRALYAQGRFRDAAAAFERGQAELDDADSELSALLDAGFLTVAIMDPTLHERGAARAAALVRRPPQEDTPSHRAVLANIAAEFVFRGERHEIALELTERALAGGKLLLEQTSEGDAPYVITGVLVWCDRFEQAVRCCDELQADARRLGSVMAFATASFCRVEPLIRLGRLAEAVADGQQAIDAERYGWQAYSLLARGQTGLALAERGQLTEAYRALEIEDEEKWRESQQYSSFLHARGSVHLLAGRPRDAYDDFAQCGQRLGLLTNNPAIVPWRSQAALALAQLGDRDQALQLVDSELEHASRFGTARPVGVALRAKGLISRGDEGLGLLRESVAVLEPSEAHLDHARALTILGAAMRRAGQRTPARETLRQALDAAERYGARTLADQAREELVAAGARPRRAALRGVDALTPAERRVAELASKGLSNREIAESLFVTRKAVEFHLRGIYRKLGIDSRADLPSAMEESTAE